MKKTVIKEHNEKKLSKEERLYDEACALQEAVSCVTKFEIKASSLQGAAKKFQKLEDYKDAKQRAAQCISDAETALVEGCQEVYQITIEMEKNAQVKSDFAEAIVEWKRLRAAARTIFETRQLKSAQKLEMEADEHIQFCKSRIAKIENRAAWIRRLVLLLILAVIAGIARLFLQ